MSGLVNKHTKVICRGFTGSQGTVRSEKAIADIRRPLLQAHK